MPRPPIQTLAELPFHRRPAAELLNLHLGRETPDPDYTGYGHARVDAVDLEGRDGRRVTVRDALLLALHCADGGGEPMPDDVELEFFVQDVAPDYSVTALLSAFLARWLPGVYAGEPAVVLALCNPHRAALPQPAALGATPLHYAEGDVESWMDPGPPAGRPRLRLTADLWRTAGEVR